MISVRWVGGKSGIEEDLLAREQVDFMTIPAAGIHGVGLRRLPGNLITLWKGFLAARKIIRDYEPDAMFFTGGYLAVPIALAGFSIPSLLFVPDIKPGLALSVIARFTDSIAVVVEEARSYFSTRKDVRVSGYPVRRDLLKWERKGSFEAMELEPDQETLLVFGGSKGARSINYALLKVLPDLLTKVQVIHISGKLDYEDILQQTDQMGEELKNRYRLFPYLHEEMGAALCCADLVVSRAGASILGEYPRFAVPAIVVPYPHAWDYQLRNARYLEKLGAAEILLDQELDQELQQTVEKLLEDPAKLSQMSEAMCSASKPEAASYLASWLKLLGGNKPEVRSV